MSHVVPSIQGKAREVSGLISAGILSILLGAGWNGPGDVRASAGHPPTASEEPGKFETSDITRDGASDLAGLKRRLQKVVLESDNWTFRPTVLIRRGTSQGSGTIIASLDGETLILTAAHVIRGNGPILVELHRYNLGLEHLPSSPGKWPRLVTGEQAASDPAADIAIVRVRNMISLPFVARLEVGDEEPPPNAEVTSVGIDLGTKLSSWKTRLVEVLGFELSESGTDRPFIVTARIPEHGRSGGGLFDERGRLVGVCVGHAELVKGQRRGVFSSVDNVREMLRQNELSSVIEQSEAARKARLARSQPASRRLSRPGRSAVTPTEAKERRPAIQP